MSYQGFHKGAGASHNHTAPGVSSSLLTANSTLVAATPAPGPALPGRQLTNTHPCTWPGCPRFFASPHNVQQHIREKHTHEKPYKCEECAASNIDSAFSRQYGLNRHRAQVHGIGEKPSRIPANRRTFGAVAPAQAAQRVSPSPVPAQEAEVDVRGGDDVETPDVQFSFDAEQPETVVVHNAQNDGVYACGDCGHAAATRDDVIMHMHVVHQVPNSPFCACNLCKTTYYTSEIDAFDQGSRLGKGGLQTVREDARFLGEGAGFATASIAAWQPDSNPTADYTASTIDPVHLTLPGSGASVGTSSELPSGR